VHYFLLTASTTFEQFSEVVFEDEGHGEEWNIKKRTQF
jgi:hypothetical protein